MSLVAGLPAIEGEIALIFEGDCGKRWRGSKETCKGTERAKVHQ